MAVTLTTWRPVAGNRLVLVVLVDTIANLPAVGVVAGATAYVEAEGTLYVYNGATWSQLTGSGPGGAANSYFPAGWS